MRRYDSEVSRPGSERISLKAFWQAVEGRLAACSADELRAIPRSLAQAARLRGSTEASPLVWGQNGGENKKATFSRKWPCLCA
jgi:hypothetical protein